MNLNILLLIQHIIHLLNGSRADHIGESDSVVSHVELGVKSTNENIPKNP